MLVVAFASSMLLSKPSQAATINVTGVSTFDSRPGGILADWTHTYTSGSPDVKILSIKINLNSNLFFDTAAGAPGFLTNQNVATTADGGTSFSGFSASGAGLDGGTMVTLSFSDFNPGESYTHVGDVDELVTLQSCGGLPPLSLAACILANTLATTDGSLVSGAEFAGSTIDVTLGGPLVANPVTVTGIFQATGANVATATWTGTVNVVPEPSTYLLTGSLLAALAWVRRRR